MEYEIIREIFNQCSNNQMRDVFIEEKDVADPEEYVKSMLKGREVKIEKDVDAAGVITFNCDTAGLLQRFTFTQI